MDIKKISFAAILSFFVFAQSASATVIVPVPGPVETTVTSPEGPVSGEFQGMITSVTQRFISINNSVLQVTGDTGITYNGGLTNLAIGQVVNYSYATDVDGVMIATTIDAYPAQAVSGTERVSSLTVTNETGKVELSLYNGNVVEYFQPYAFITSIGTKTSFGNQLVNYVGFINPTTGRILATSGYMSDIPVVFKATLPTASVGQAYNQFAIVWDSVGNANPLFVTATGLPEGLINTMGVISGIPTTAGTYQIGFSAIGGQYNVNPYTEVGRGTTTLVVGSSEVAPVPTPVACNGVGIVVNYPTSKFWLEVSVDGAAPVKVNFASQASTTFVAPATNFENGQTVSYTGTYDVTGIFCNADTMTITPAPVVVVPDTVAPVITMIGGDVSLVEGSSYTDQGATCTDDVDATCTVTTSSTVNTSLPGAYTVTYSATDMAGNAAVPVVRSVTVTPAPVVTPPVTDVVSTGKKVERTYQIITAVYADSIMVKSTKIRIVPTTIIKLANRKPLAVGTRIEYKGILNTDGSITAIYIKVQ